MSKPKKPKSPEAWMETVIRALPPGAAVMIAEQDGKMHTAIPRDPEAVDNEVVDPRSPAGLMVLFAALTADEHFDLYNELWDRVINARADAMLEREKKVAN